MYFYWVEGSSYMQRGLALHRPLDRGLRENPPRALGATHLRGGLSPTPALASHCRHQKGPLPRKETELLLPTLKPPLQGRIGRWVTRSIALKLLVKDSRILLIKSISLLVGGWVDRNPVQHGSIQRCTKVAFPRHQTMVSSALGVWSEAREQHVLRRNTS